MFMTVSCGDIGNISEMVDWITEGGAEKWKGCDKHTLPLRSTPWIQNTVVPSRG